MRIYEKHTRESYLNPFLDHLSRPHQVSKPDMNGYLAAGHISPIHRNQKRISTEIVGQVAQADCYRCPNETDTPQYRGACPLNLDSKNMFYPGTSFSSCPVASLFPIGEFLAVRTLAEYVPGSPSPATRPSFPKSDRQNQPRHCRCYSLDQAVLQRRCCHVLPHCLQNRDESVYTSHPLRYGSCNQRNFCCSFWTSEHRYLSGSVCGCSNLLARRLA